MKFKYLGTAAAEAVPAPFCECAVCENARLKKGRNVRTRPQAMVDDTLLIDFGPDTMMHTILNDIKLCSLSACLVTHPHYDHLFPEELFCRGDKIANMKVERTFHFYGTQETADTLRSKYKATAQLEQEGRIQIHVIEPFKPFEVAGYRVTALSADHSSIQPVIYIIEKDGKSMLYAHDTGLFPEETMDYLKTIDIVFDFVSYDCTNVLLEWDNRRHMGLTGDSIMRERLRDLGRVGEKTIHVVNHFSHNGLAGYDELVPIAAEKGFEVSYDGMEVVF